MTAGQLGAILQETARSRARRLAGVLRRSARLCWVRCRRCSQWAGAPHPPGDGGWINNQAAGGQVAGPSTPWRNRTDICVAAGQPPAVATVAKPDHRIAVLVDAHLMWASLAAESFRLATWVPVSPPTATSRAARTPEAMVTSATNDSSAASRVRIDCSARRRHLPSTRQGLASPCPAATTLPQMVRLPTVVPSREIVAQVQPGAVLAYLQPGSIRWW